MIEPCLICLHPTSCLFDWVKDLNPSQPDRPSVEVLSLRGLVRSDEQHRDVGSFGGGDGSRDA